MPAIATDLIGARRPADPVAGAGLAWLLLLADGRLPAGGHAHSGGVEAAVAGGLLRGLTDLEGYLAGRLATTGRVDAAVAVAAWRMCRQAPPDAEAPVDRSALVRLEAEAAARTASPAQRAASRSQGRGLLRVARRCWSAPSLEVVASVHPDGPLAPMVLGAAGAIGALTAPAVATAALWSVVSAPAWAAVRLLGLDPLEVTAMLARQGPCVDGEAGVAATAWGVGERPVQELPAAGAPLTEIGAEGRAGWEVRLFAS